MVEIGIPLTASRSEIHAALSGLLPAVRRPDGGTPSGYPPEPGAAEPSAVYAYLLHDLGIWNEAFAEQFTRSFVLASFAYHTGSPGSGAYAAVTVVEESPERTRYRTLAPLDHGGPTVGTPMSIVEGIVEGKYHQTGETGVFERDWRGTG